MPPYMPPYVYTPVYAHYTTPGIPTLHPVPAAEYTPLTWASCDRALGSNPGLIREMRRREPWFSLKV